MELKPEFIKRSRELLGNDAEEYFKILDKPLTDAIRVNTLKINQETLIKRLESRGWILKQVPFCKQAYWVLNGPERIGSTIEHFLGYYYVQEPASMVPPLLMNLTEGLKVLDMCASPGSKTGEIGMLTNDEGLLVANDVNIGRVSILKYNTQRMGLRSVVITRRDGNNYARNQEFFDRILVDAPCSGEGIIRKNPYVAVQWNEKTLPSFGAQQKDLLYSGYKALAPGGTIVYSTCSLAPEEDEEVVNNLIEHTNAVIEPARIPGLKTRPGITSWHGKELRTELTNCARIYPQDNDTEGFFCTKVRKPE